VRFSVIPAQAGIRRRHWLDSRLRGNDELMGNRFVQG
jgi:hypothetical protein